ncbi:hypothetical protein Slin14017_G064200 [Septoria linicola]|nr:hypothetical protein Slin14017_G064200 [Septoria linicola]
MEQEEPMQKFFEAAFMDDEGIPTYGAQAVGQSAALNSLLVASDFDLEFPSLADQHATAGFRIALAQVQKQNFVTQQIYNDRQLPLSKWLYNAYCDQNVSLRRIPGSDQRRPQENEGPSAEKLFLDQRRFRRNVLRQAALKSQRLRDVTLMIIEWGGDFNSALSLPPMALPGERYVRLEDMWPDSNWSEASLAKSRSRTEPEGMSGEELKVDGCCASCDEDRLLGMNSFLDFDKYYGSGVARGGGNDKNSIASSDVPKMQLMPDFVYPTRPVQSVPITHSDSRKRPRQDSQTSYTYAAKFLKTQQIAYASESSQRHGTLLQQNIPQMQQRPRSVPSLPPQYAILPGMPSGADGLPMPIAQLPSLFPPLSSANDDDAEADLETLSSCVDVDAIDSPLHEGQKQAEVL